MVGVEDLEVGHQGLVAARFSGLALERSDLPLHFLDDVANAQKVRVGRLQFAERFAFLAAVFGDAGGFFKDRAAIFRARAQDQIDLALLHDRVGAAAHAGVGEEVLDVF